MWSSTPAEGPEKKIWENKTKEKATNPNAKSVLSPKILVWKGQDGWKASTMVYDVNGYDWQITTVKFDKGMIRCYAQGGKSTSATSFSCVLMVDPNIDLHAIKKRATEKSIREAHRYGLERFNIMLENGELPENKSKEEDINVGQVIFMVDDVQDEHHHDRLVIYNTFDGPDGTHYEYVNLETFKLGRTSDLMSIEAKLGRGFYFKKGDTVEKEVWTKALTKAKELEEEAYQKKHAQDLQEAAERKKKIEAGMKLINVPENAKAMIIGRLNENTSKPYDDFSSRSVSKMIYLGYSNHTKNLFPELRKAALNADEVKHLSDAPAGWEHRENYSLGKGYFIAKDPYSGWEVKKTNFDPENKEAIENWP